MGRNYDVINIANIFIKTTFSESKKEKLRIKVQSLSALFDIRKAAAFQWKMLMSAEQKGV